VKAILELASRQGIASARISMDEWRRRHPGSRGLVFHAEKESLSAKADLEGFLPAWRRRGRGRPRAGPSLRSPQPGRHIAFSRPVRRLPGDLAPGPLRARDGNGHEVICGFRQHGCLRPRCPTCPGGGAPQEKGFWIYASTWARTLVGGDIAKRAAAFVLGPRARAWAVSSRRPRFKSSPSPHPGTWIP
jgi:hypothetical protein